MTDPRDDPLDEVADEFRRLPVPDRPDDGPLLARLTRGTDLPRSHHPLRRLLMRPAVRYAAAAVFLPAVAWLALGPPPPPVLAEVIRAAEQHKLVRFRATQTAEDKEVRALTSTAYVDIARPRVRVEAGFKTFNGILDFRYTAVYDYPRDRFLATVSHEQVVTKDQAKDDFQAKLVAMVEERGLARKEAVVSRIARTKTDAIPPMSLLGQDHGLMDSLRRLQTHKDTRSTRAEADGPTEAEYRLAEGGRVTRLRVDTRTKLPTRVEVEVLGPAPDSSKETYVFDNFEWDPKVADPEALFNTDPPAGYALEDHTSEP